MKFLLKLTDNYDDSGEKDYEKLGFINHSARGWWDDPGGKRPEIEINTAEELVAFQKKWGEIIITEVYHSGEEGRPMIEIYNGYRE